MVFPNGYDGKGKSLSIFLLVQDLPPMGKVYAQGHLRVRNQLNFDKEETEGMVFFCFVFFFFVISVLGLTITLLRLFFVETLLIFT